MADHIPRNPYWRSRNSTARFRATVGAAAAVSSSFTRIASLARRTVEGEAQLPSGSDRLAIFATSQAILLGTVSLFDRARSSSRTRSRIDSETAPAF